MKQAKTFKTFAVTFFLTCFFLLSGIQQGESQCEYRCYFNGIEIANGGSLDYILGPGECCVSLSMASLELRDDNSCATCGDALAGAISQVSISNAGVLGLGNPLDINDLVAEACATIDPLTGVVSSTAVTFTITNRDNCAGGMNFTATVNVTPYPNAITSLACNDNVQLSLDENCEATVTPDMILEGGPYRCFDSYIVQVLDGGPNGTPIDRSPSPGVQLDGNDFGNCYTTRIIDPVTGNSCWGELCVEDKLDPVIECNLRPIIVPCGSDVSPDVVGYPNVIEACGRYVLTYTDMVDERGCGDPDMLDRVITRTWKAEDESGNIGTCEEEIWVLLGTLAGVALPDNRDDIIAPAFECDHKYDATKDVTPHMVNFPLCVDGYLLDSAHWLATGGFPAGGPNSGQRQPKVLGWNCIQSGPYEGHPAPGGVYYDEHPNWSIFGGCWGPDEYIMWEGSGYPTGVNCGNINYTFSDVKINAATANCDAGEVGCYKILRKWTILNWCTGEILEGHQVIKVIDKKGPEITYPDEVIVGMTSSSCTGIWVVTPPWVEDNCSAETHYTVHVGSGTLLGNENTGFTVIDLPGGWHKAHIEATDCCGNTSRHELDLHVVDDVSPVAVCDAHTVLSLSGNGATKGINTTLLAAESLDDGSYDNCNDVYFKIIRMDDLLGTNNGSFADNVVSCAGANGDDDAIRAGGQVYFDDYAEFCCEDVGQSIMVVLRVFDVDPGAGPIIPNRMNPGGNLSGRFSDCMVEVDVQDKTTPLVVAPPDLVISCMFWFDDSEDALTDPDNSTFGRVVTDLAWRDKVTTKDKLCEALCEENRKIGYLPSAVQNGLACDYYNDLYDPAHPDDLHDLTWGFDGYVLSTCGTDFEITIRDDRECGQGLISRTVEVRQGNVVYRDIQRIWVVNCDPFYISDNCQDPDDDIVWPLNCLQPGTIEGCGADTSPDNPRLGRPELLSNGLHNCALVIVDYKDEVYTIEPDACYKIIRTWTVIDWCTYDPINTGDKGRWEYVQIIKVNDGTNPEVKCIVGDCEPAEKDAQTQTCNGHISLTVDAEDECTPDNWLNYEYKIDLDNDGDYDVYSGPGKPGSVASKYDNPYADDEKDPTDASGTYPQGEHRITWFISDGCGNIGLCDTTFVIKDCKLPTPYCKTGIITVVMPTTGSIAVWATDLDAGSFDNCTWPENLKFYFNGDVTQTNYVINCDTFENRGATGSVIIEVELWVEDEEGNADYCITQIEVQDPNNVCDGGVLPSAIAGKVFTEALEYVEEVEVGLSMNNSSLSDQMTNDDGYYAFMNLTDSQNYTVQPIKDDNYVNGVTTADLVTIQRHLLGLTELSSTYKLIAADANNSESISAADISTLRKLVLGLVSELPDVNSWRFVPEAFDFVDTKNPWAGTGFPEDISYTNLNAQMMLSDFIAVKVGDVTGDAKVNGLTTNKTRSNGSFVFAAADQTFAAGELVTVALSADDLAEISGYQFSLEYNTDILSFETYESGAINLYDANFGFIQDGLITTSWNDFGNELGEGSAFTLVFRAISAGTLSSALSFNSALTKAEAYGHDLETMDVNLEFRGEDGLSIELFELLQNVPNPFENETTIGFTLPQDMPASMTVYNVMGKVLRVVSIDGNKGYNEVSLSTSDLETGGIMYYQLDAGNNTATRKMLSVN